MFFHYQVLNKSKKMFEGEIEAIDIKRARMSLIQQGYDVVSLANVKDKKNIIKKFSSIGFVSLKEKMLFIKHLSLMIKSGLVLDEALEALYEQSRSRMRTILFRLMTVVRKGNLLSDGLKLFPYTFSDFFVNMVKVGEQSGTLEENLLNLSVKLHKDHDLKTKIRAALLYPMIVVTALVGLGLSLSVFVLPKLLGFFKTLDVDIPLATKTFIIFAEFIENYWVFVVVALVVTVVGVIVINKIRQTQVVTHWVVLNAPLFRQFSATTNLANFCRSMNLLLKSGITIDESLKIMGRAANNVLYKRKISEILRSVRKGDKLSVSLARHHHYFPGIVTKMIHVGEISGNLDETFEYLAEYFEDELDNMSKNLSVVLEPILLVIIGLLVGFVAMAIIAPIYSLTGGIGA